MKKVIMKSVLAAVASVGLMASGAMALTINYASVTDTDKTLTTTNIDAIVWNFDSPNNSLDVGSTYASMFKVLEVNTAAIVTGSMDGKYAAPYNTTNSTADLTNYLTVPEKTSSGSGYITIGLEKESNYFGLFWGSIDSYNTIEFYLNGTLTQKFTGSDITSSNIANGNQTARETNIYVNFYGLNTFDSFKLSSSQFAFEVDNIAVAPIPEPGVSMLFALGVVGFAGVVRRRRTLTV